MIPTGWQLVVLALACFRWTRLIGWDDLPPIQRLRNRATGASYTQTGSQNAHFNVTDEPAQFTWTFKRPTLHHFLSCAYCQGFWVCLVVYLAWLAWPTGTMYAAMPFALSTAVGTWARRLDP